MRFLIAFLLLSYFHISDAGAIAKGNDLVAHNPIKKAVQVLDRAITFSKKENTSINREPFSEYLDRIHQIANYHSFTTILGYINNCTTYFYTPLKSVKIFRRKVNYSYLFTFNCLYPKHTFW